MRGNAIVIGGGIGGLATGRALAANGWNIDIRERAPGLPDSGAALGMWPSAMEALDRLGVGDEVRRLGVLQHGATIRRPDGRVFARLGGSQSAYLIGRPALHRLLHGDALSDHVSWDAPVRSIDEFARADLIVAADGINSVARAQTFGGNGPRPLGTVAFRGDVPSTVDTVTATWGRGRLFGITPQDADTTNWFACVRSDVLAEHDRGQPAAELLRELYGDWHPAVVDVIDRLGDREVDRRALQDSAPLTSYVSDNVALIGDAAHAMAPDLGRGACEAVVDAVALADALASAQTIAGGLQEYDRRRRRETQRIVRAARFLNRVSTTRRLTRIRNLAIGAAARLA